MSTGSDQWNLRDVCIGKAYGSSNETGRVSNKPSLSIFSTPYHLLLWCPPHPKYHLVIGDGLGVRNGVARALPSSHSVEIDPGPVVDVLQGVVVAGEIGCDLVLDQQREQHRRQDLCRAIGPNGPDWIVARNNDVVRLGRRQCLNAGMVRAGGGGRQP